MSPRYATYSGALLHFSGAKKANFIHFACISPVLGGMVSCFAPCCMKSAVLGYVFKLAYVCVLVFLNLIWGFASRHILLIFS